MSTNDFCFHYSFVLVVYQLSFHGIHYISIAYPKILAFSQAQYSYSYLDVNVSVHRAWSLNFRYMFCIHYHSLIYLKFVFVR